MAASSRALAVSGLVLAFALLYGAREVDQPGAAAAALLSDTVFCSPNWQGQLGATLLQFSIWAFITNYEYGVMAWVERVVTGKSWYRVVQENYRDDDAQKVYQFADPGFNYVAFCGTVVHHGGGGLLMLAGMLSGQAWLWRHGMLVEVGGMDILDFFRILHCKLCPPGSRPTNMYMKSGIFVPMMILHHMVGLCVGIPVNLFFSEHAEFQLFGFVILGAPAISLAPGLFAKTLQAAEYPRTLKANQIWMFVTFGLGQRILYYFPAAIRCSLFMWRSEAFCWQIGVPLGLALFSMSLFNLVLVGIQARGLHGMLTAADEEEERRELLRGMSGSVTLSDATASMSISVSRGLDNIFVTSRMVAKARAAKKAVQSRRQGSVVVVKSS